jgi:hypothetical protein
MHRNISQQPLGQVVVYTEPTILEIACQGIPPAPANEQRAQWEILDNALNQLDPCERHPFLAMPEQKARRASRTSRTTSSCWPRYRNGGVAKG